MKVVPQKSDYSAKKKPLLPLVPDPEEELTSSNSLSYNLNVSPGVTGSATYKKYIRVLAGGESIHSILTWVKDTEEVFRGLNANDAADKYNILSNLVNGSAKTLLDNSLEQSMVTARAAAAQAAYNAATGGTAAQEAARDAILARSKTMYLVDAHITEAKRDLIKGLVPNKIVAMVKRYLRRECRKPPEMKIRTFYQNLLRVNGEIVALPPFQPDQDLKDDEIVDILMYAVPKSWVREMDRQGFDPITKNPGQVVDFLERIEQAEDFDGQKVDHGQKSSGNNSGKKKKGNSSSSNKKFCLIHGHGGHSSDECKVLQDQAKKLKTSGGNSSGGNQGKYSNKTWSRKASESTNNNKKELAAFIKKQVKQGVKELNSVDKKRKASSSDGEDGFAFAKAFEGDLKGFNYEEMENLKIDSDDEISI